MANIVALFAPEGMKIEEEECSQHETEDKKIVWSGEIRGIETGMDEKRKQVSRGYNIVVDGWTWASNPHTHSNPNNPPTPYIQAYTKKYLKHLFFPLFSMITTDG